MSLRFGPDRQDFSFVKWHSAADVCQLQCAAAVKATMSGMSSRRASQGSDLGSRVERAYHRSSTSKISSADFVITVSPSGYQTPPLPPGGVWGHCCFGTVALLSHNSMLSVTEVAMGAVASKSTLWCKMVLLWCSVLLFRPNPAATW